MNSGIAVHCHHDVLFEHVYDYDQRVEYIRNAKPPSEVKIRLEVFQLVPEKYYTLLHAEWVKATVARNKARAEVDKARAVWSKATAEVDKAYAEVDKAYVVFYKADAEVDKAYNAWDKADREKIHKLVCGCKYWNGEKLVF